jgi:4-hydroxy-tetrahydrodipicolinate synthase
LRDLQGVVPPMFTPFAEDDRIDVDGLIREAKFLKQCGVAGMVVGGSMGEGAGMSAQELSEAVRTVIEAVEGELPVFAAVIADSSAEAIRQARAARAAGANGLQVPPPHFHISADTNVLAAYYRAITDASEVPLLIYNVMPTAQAAVESLEQLIQDNPAILGIKQSGRNIHTLAALVAVMAGKAKIFTAIDDMIFPCFMLGVDGTISGTSTIFPRQTVEMLNAVKSGQYGQALELHKRLSPVWRSVDFPDFAARAKFAATLGGRNVGRPRGPLQWPTGEAARRIEEAMLAGGLLKEEIAAPAGSVSGDSF